IDNGRDAALRRPVSAARRPYPIIDKHLARCHPESRRRRGTSQLLIASHKYSRAQLSLFGYWKASHNSSGNLCRSNHCLAFSLASLFAAIEFLGTLSFQRPPQTSAKEW